MNNLIKRKKSTAFTLAEVLITIGIIGIIATLTLPTIIQNINERVTVTKVKKFYADINQAMQNSIADNGGVALWNYNGETKESTDVFADIFKKHMKIGKDCGNGYDCTIKKIMFLNNTPRGDYWYANRIYRKMLLHTGGLIWFRANSTPGKCTDTDAGYNNVCGILWYDANGDKTPNTFGEDIFIFVILKDRIAPNLTNDCNSTSQNGWGCANYILKYGDMSYLHKK